MKKEHLIRYMLGVALIVVFGVAVYIFNTHFEQTKSVTHPKSSGENEVIAVDQGESESPATPETPLSQNDATHDGGQGISGLSNTESTRGPLGTDERSHGDYDTFKSSHMPYSRSIAGVFPVTETSTYTLEYEGSDSRSGCTYNNSISLSKVDTDAKKYIPIIDDVCFMSDGELINAFYPVWSQDERYVAFVDERTFTFNIFDRETPHVLPFVDTMNLHEGIQVVELPGFSDGLYGWPRLEFDFSTVRKTEDGHIQVIGIGAWDYRRDGYVYIFDFTDWSLKEILTIEPNDDVLMGAEWVGEKAVRVYTISTDAIKKCEEDAIDQVGGRSKLPWLPSSYYDCRKINFSNFAQLETRTIPF